ncbi:hypothetical protein FGL97_09040 [Pseudomonas putida]|uniref:hypothetical protein n=1 Tax=Pseudomonas putida TaxID=303 RepID=UPI00159E98CD|nr:hypothetical protein [Pseudomonas putida]NVN63368.1 hypothetical protein [Pseudomonas putida]NVN68361.1 hypothetical protein [Pseudomonas putida]
MNLSKFIPNPLCAMASGADPRKGAPFLSSIEQACAGPLVQMLRGQPLVPKSPHYDSFAKGLHLLLGTVDPQLIDDAVAEKARGVTLH